MSWLRMKQTAVPHSRSESEIICFDEVLRMDGLPALQIWDRVKQSLFNAQATVGERWLLKATFGKNTKKSTSSPETIKV